MGRHAASGALALAFPLGACCISVKPAAASCTSGGKSDISCTWRTSMISFSPPGQREAHSMASSREATLIIQ
jgi:hypothetical protein